MADEKDFILFPKTQIGSVRDEKPARLTIKEFQNNRLYVTRVSGGAKPNYQLMYSLGDDIFLNTFSERMSMWDLTGLHIMNHCEEGEEPGEPPFLTFYKQYNIKTEQIVTMSFAGITMKGYLVDMRIQDYSQDGIEGFQFTLKYLALLQNLVDAANNPTKEGSGTGSGSGGGDRLASTLTDNINGSSNGSPPVVSASLPPLSGGSLA